MRSTASAAVPRASSAALEPPSSFPAIGTVRPMTVPMHWNVRVFRAGLSGLEVGCIEGRLQRGQVRGAGDGGPADGLHRVPGEGAAGTGGTGGTGGAAGGSRRA